MQNLGEECPVLFYKGQNEKEEVHGFQEHNFCLIIMTHFQTELC